MKDTCGRIPGKIIYINSSEKTPEENFYKNIRRAAPGEVPGATLERIFIV